VKPAPFTYAKAKTVEHAIELLARPDGEARLSLLKNVIGLEIGSRAPNGALVSWYVLGT
jgi:hypothetical protein